MSGLVARASDLARSLTRSTTSQEHDHVGHRGSGCCTEQESGRVYMYASQPETTSQTRDYFNRKSSPSSQNKLLLMSVKGFFKSFTSTSKDDLAAAASSGDLNSLRQLIEVKPSRVNKVLNDVTWMDLSPTHNSQDGDTALILAVRQGRIEIVKMLLSFGADVNHSRRVLPH